jgi:hypothetical protein
MREGQLWRALTKRDEFLAVAARLAGVGLALGGVLVLFVFASFFYQYTWTGQRQFASPLYIATYYGGPLILAALFFASLRLSPVDRINVFIACVSAGASVYAVELYLDWRYSSLYASPKPVMTLLANSTEKEKDAATLTRQWGGAIDTRTAGEALAELQRTDADAVPIMTPANHLFIRQADGSIKSSISIDGQEVMPLAAVSNRVTLLCTEIGQWINYRTDGRGFNNPAEIWNTQRLEIAVLGDSFAQGYCVPNDKNFVALIRQRHPATLNLGVAGDGPLLMIATLKEYLPHFMPKTMLWFYFEGNDLTDLQVEMKSPLLRNYLKDGFTQQDLARQNDIDRAIVDEIPRLRALDQANRERREANAASGRVKDFMRLSMLRQRLGMVGGMDEDVSAASGANIEVFRGILLQAKMQVEGWRGRMLFVYLPDWARYTSNTSVGEVARDEVLALVRALGIPIIDIHRAFEAHGDPLSLFPFRRPGHYNEIGHRLVAEEVLKTLAQRQ